MTTEKIKEIPIIDVMDKLWIKYFKKNWSEYWIYDWNNKTSWRSFNTSKNIVHDFSSGRADWDCFWFVKSQLSLSYSETFKRFEDNYHFGNKQTVMTIRDTLSDINENQIEYLKTRGIKHEYINEIVRNYKWWICCLVYDKDWPIGWNTRTLFTDHNKRFMGITWFSTKGIYKHKIDNNKSYLIVVEWLIDFLTLRQFESNVVGLKSSDCWQDEIKELAKQFDLIVCNDNDQAWIKILDNLKGLNYKRFDVSKFGNYKDINDLHKDFMSKDIIGKILNECKETLPIQTAFEKMFAMQKIMKEQGKLWEDWPFQFYNLTQWIIKGKVYTIWAYSNVWKSKFAYYHTQYFLKKWKKVLFINLEVDEWMCLMEIIKSYECLNFKDIINWDWNINIYRDLTIRDDLRNLDSICEVIEELKPDIVFIDYVQNIQNKWWNDYEKHSKTAIELQSIAIRTWCTLFNLSQLSNNMWKEVWRWTADFISLKWSWDYFACSDVILILSKQDPDDVRNLQVSIAKNKYWKKENDINLEIDFSRNQFIQTNIQKEENF